MRFSDSVKRGGSRKSALAQNNVPVNPDLKAIFKCCRERRPADLDRHLKALAKRGLAGLVNKAEKRNGDTAFHLAAQLDAIKATQWETCTK